MSNNLKSAQAVRRESGPSGNSVIVKSDALLAQPDQNYNAHYTKTLALGGLALCEGPQHLTAASDSYRAARAITAADGIIHENLQLFDALALADTERTLAPVRRVLAGEE